MGMKSFVLGLLLASALHASVVNKVSDACAVPRPEFGDEVLTTDPKGVLAEWTASLNALPNGPVKTDLLNRLLNRVISPGAFFSDKNKMREFLRSAVPPLYMRPPFRDNSPFEDGSSTQIGSGWIYNNGGSHRGLDISRSGWSGNRDPAIDVFAAADGKVIGVYFDAPPGGGGNTIVIEHTGAGGAKVYTFYMHLRDGRAHDVAAVKALACSASDKACQNYRDMAIKFPNHPAWGTDADKILVKPGDLVRQGQKIAKSGNTMTAMTHVLDGGAPPDNSTNNHLHVYTAVPSPTDPKTVIYVDPYGVYNEQSTDCYQPTAKTFFHLFFAPFPRDFSGVPSDWFQSGFDYFASIGEWPESLSAYHGGGLVMAGAFKPGKNRPVRDLITFDDAKTWFEKSKNEGFRPDRVQVVDNRVTVIYKPIEEEFIAECGLSFNDFAAMEQKHPGFSAIDLTRYDSGGEKFCGVWIEKDVPHKVEVGMTPARFATFDAAFRKEGFHVTKFIAYGGDRRFAALWQKLPGDWALVQDADPATVQSQYDKLVGEGFQLYYVNGDTGRLSSVYRK